MKIELIIKIRKEAKLTTVTQQNINILYAYRLGTNTHRHIKKAKAKKQISKFKLALGRIRKVRWNFSKRIANAHAQSQKPDHNSLQNNFLTKIHVG